jgi:hypothetical protein
MKLFETLITVLGALTFLIVLSFLLSWPVYMLWNGCLVGAVTSVNEVTWLQAWGITILCGFLFKAKAGSK